MNSQLINHKNLILTEEDVRRLILTVEKSAPKINRIKINSVWQKVSAVIFVVVVLFILINLPAFVLKTKYFFNTNVARNSDSSSISAPEVNSNTSSNSANALTNSLVNNHLYINRIGVSAPIIWDVADNDKDQLLNLQNGVIHLSGQAKPGQIGNIFIVGHSSYSIFAKGNYKTVFALLPELTVGDKITITYNNQVFEYTVSSTKIVSPNNVSIRTKTDDQTLTLMTCVPVGTNLKRLAIIAKPTTTTVTNAQLPKTD